MTSLSGALPELRNAERTLRALAAAAGVRYSLADFGGLRSESDTTTILDYRRQDYAAYVKRMRATGRTPDSIDVFRPINQYGNSMHNFGAAFDVVMVSGSIPALGALAPRAGLRWGGHFARQDPPHFELPITLGDARGRFAAMGARPGQSVGLESLAHALDQADGASDAPAPAASAPRRSQLVTVAAVVAALGVWRWA